MKNLGKVIEKEENNWFKIEAWLWIGLFFLLSGVFHLKERL